MTRLERQDRWLRAAMLAAVRGVCVVGILWSSWDQGRTTGVLPSFNSVYDPNFGLNLGGPWLVAQLREFAVSLVWSLVLWGGVAAFSRPLSRRLVPRPAQLGNRAPRAEQAIRIALRSISVVLLLWIADGVVRASGWQTFVTKSLSQMLQVAGLITTVLLASVPISMLFVERRVVRWMVAGWPPASACPKCGYDLSGLSGPVCPECGADVREAKKK